MKTYIVYTGNSENDETSSLLHYKNLLWQVAADRLPFLFVCKVLFNSYE